jgi:hypothetical protein
MEDIPRLMQIGLATCHAVTVLNGQFIGKLYDTISWVCFW